MLKNRVGVIGGFNAANDNDATRDADPAGVTFLTGVYMSGGQTLNVQAVVTGNTTLAPNTTVLDGFTVTGGASSSTNGCGISLTSQASPLIIRCRIFANLGTDSALGGGLYCDSTSAPIVDTCTFEANTGGSGGAIYCFSSALIQNCTFKNNSQTGAASTDGGGAIHVFSGAPSITVCNFVGNISAGNKGGGAIVNRSTASGGWEIKRCTFTGNQSRADGAADSSYRSGGGAIANHNGTLTVRDCLLLRNTAFRNGGAGG